MPIMKKGSKSKWTTIDNHCFFDKELRYKDIGLLCNMLSLPDDWKFNVRGLASLHEDGVESVSNCLNHLIEKGYVYREQPNSSKGFKDIIYWVYENPEDNPHFHSFGSNSPCTENPYTGNPYTGKPDTEKAYTEKHDLLNTKESSTDQLNMYESDSDSDGHVYSEEEIFGWNDEEFYSNLSSREYDSFLKVIDAWKKGEIHTSKESLIEYFKKRKAGGWKDSAGKPIRNIDGYIISNFTLHTENERKKRKK